MILILTQCFPPDTGGIETLMGGLARALAAGGEDVLVYADGRGAAADADAPFGVRRFGGLKPLRRRLKARAAARLCRAGNIRAVFCDSWKSAEFLPSLPAPVTVLAHGTEYPPQPSPGKKRRIVATLDRVSRVFAVSQATAQRVATCGAPAGKMSVVHPPLEKPAPPTVEDNAAADALWGDGAPRVLTVARLAARKGVDAGVAAVVGLAAEYPSIRYVIAGVGEEEENLRELARQAGAADRVVFAGRVGAGLRTALCAGADVFLLPARMRGADMEGYGIVFLEAGYSGAASIAGASGGAAEAVEDGVTGLHCDGDNADSVRAALSRLLADDGLRRRLATAARAKAQAALWENRVGDFL